MYKNLLLLLQILLIIASTEGKSFFHVEDGRFYDQDGGERIFHGLNFVFQNRSHLEDFRYMRSLGINAMRVSLSWDMFQPKEGQFDEVYLRNFVDFVNAAGEYNISSLIEYHQDIFGPKFCGNGCPIWSVGPEIYSSFPIPVQKTPVPYNPTTGRPDAFCNNFPNWSQLYLTKAVNKAYGCLWRNKGGLLDKFIRYWRRVVGAFKGNRNVIAYQLFNEPWPGDLYKDPLVMVPGLSQAINLQHAYNKISKQIRLIDPEVNICFEPVTWLNAVPSGFTSPPGGHKYSNSSLLCYHYYHPPTFNLNTFIAARMEDQKRLNVGGILSQFWVLKGQGGNDSVQVMDRCDFYSQSWFGYRYEPPNSPYKMIPEIQRTYAQRVAGSLKWQKFNTTTKHYKLLFKAHKNAGHTIIYFDPIGHYINGPNVNISVGNYFFNYTIQEKNYIRIDSKQFREGARVHVDVRQRLGPEVLQI